MALTVGAAAVTLVVIIGVLTGPTLVTCFNSADGMGVCLRDRMTNAGLLPAADQVVAEVESPAPVGQVATIEPDTEIAEPELDVTPPPAEGIDRAAAGNVVTATFGLLRAEPDGSVVIAGSGTPGTQVEVYANGELIGTATVEASGDWVLVPDQPISPGGSEITLAEVGREGRSAESIVVVINEDQSSEPLVVASTPGEASDILQGLRPVEDALQLAAADPLVGEELPEAQQEPLAAASGQADPAGSEERTEVAALPVPLTPSPDQSAAPSADQATLPTETEVSTGEDASGAPGTETGARSNEPSEQDEGDATPATSVSIAPVQETTAGDGQMGAAEEGAETDATQSGLAAADADELTTAADVTANQEPSSASAATAIDGAPSAETAATQPGSFSTTAQSLTGETQSGERSPASPPVGTSRAPLVGSSTDPAAGEGADAEQARANGDEPGAPAEGQTEKLEPGIEEDTAVATAASDVPTPEPTAFASTAPTIDAIEIEGDRTFFAGAGPEGGIVRLYVDNNFVADTVVQDGRWLVEGGNVLTSPSQRVRVDLLKPGSADVLARAEVDFVLELPEENLRIAEADTKSESAATTAPNEAETSSAEAGKLPDGQYPQDERTPIDAGTSNALEDQPTSTTSDVNGTTESSPEPASRTTPSQPAAPDAAPLASQDATSGADDPFVSTSAEPGTSDGAQLPRDTGPAVSVDTQPSSAQDEGVAVDFNAAVQPDVAPVSNTTKDPVPVETTAAGDTEPQTGQSAQRSATSYDDASTEPLTTPTTPERSEAYGQTSEPPASKPMLAAVEPQSSDAAASEPSSGVPAFQPPVEQSSGEEGTAGQATSEATASEGGVPTMVAVAVGDPEAQRFASGKAIIRRGDNLWTIARRVYGEGIKYTTIYQANTSQIRDPDRIYPGQVFELPADLLR